jgi:hypothetical protein
MMKHQGFLFVADITGYTAYLSGSELEHAQDSLRNLLQVLIENTKPPLVISRLEGDAVISYAPEGNYLQGQTIIESLERTYVAFRLAQQRMRLNTTCTCMACKNIPNLDLKFFVHYGEFMVQDLGPYKELIGNDVNLIHRILKNDVTNVYGVKAYILYTQNAVDALAIPELTDSLLSHTEPDEYLGQLHLLVQDLHPIWDRERDRQKVFVPPAEALFTIEEDFPIGPALLWDYLTKPEYRAILNNADGMEVENLSDGRTSSGSVYICAHGDAKIRHAIVDWQPFEYYTYESDGAIPGARNHVTVYLHPLEKGTRVIGVCGKSFGDETACADNDTFLLENVSRRAQDGCKSLNDRVRGDLDLGIIVQASFIQPTIGQIELAIDASMSG